MAASKDVFEPKVFASNVFAAGAFRGMGQTLTSHTPRGGLVSRVGPTGSLARCGAMGILERVAPVGRLKHL